MLLFQFCKVDAKYESCERERRALKAQNESLSSMNERLRTEADILHRQKSGSELLAENLKLMQHELEKAQSSSRMRLENENSDLREELGLVRKKKDQDHTEFMASMKAWEASTTEMRNDLEASKEAERIATIKVERSIADIEELNQRITGKVFFFIPNRTLILHCAAWPTISQGLCIAYTLRNGLVGGPSSADLRLTICGLIR